jgi:hypothetical protein
MSDQLPMFGPPISTDIPSAISSPASESGPTRSGLLAGQTTEKSGPEAVPANPSARPAKVKRSTTKGIFGQTSFDSSKHDDLSYALANKLRPLTASLGSTLFNLTWTVRITPAGRSISALRASEPLTEGSVFIGWPTPRSTERGHGTGNPDRANDHKSRLEDLVFLCGWPTSRAEDAESSGMRHSRGVADTLTSVAALPGWGTPAARDWKNGDASQDTLDKNARPLSEQVKLSGWTTPQAHDQTGRSQNQKEIHGTMHGCACLVSEARLSGWATPKKADGEQASETMMRGNLTMLGQARLGAWPTPMAGTPAQKGYNEAGNTDSGRKTEEMVRWNADPLTAFGDKPIGFLLGPNGWEIVPASGQLNASHSRWLMGLPPAWDDCGVTAMESLSKRRKPSLRHT